MKRILIILFIVLPLITLSQNSAIDSLKNIFQNSSNDSVKVSVLLEIYKIYEKGKINEGKTYLNQALEIAEKSDDKYLMTSVRMKLGNYYNITGEYENSLESNLIAKQICEEENNERGLGTVYNNLGATHEKMGSYDEAMDCFIKSLSISESLNDSINIAKTLLNIGLLYSRQKDYNKSLEFYNKSLELRRKLNDDEGIALLYNNIAIVNYYLEDYDNVRNYFEKAYRVYVKTGNLRRQLMALSNIAEVDKMIGQKEKALKTYFEILEIEKELGQKGEQIGTYFAVAEIYFERGDFARAENYYRLGLSIANEIGALLDQSGAYEMLSKIYRERGDFKKALEYYQKFSILNDSIYNEDKSKQIQELEAKYETKKKEQQIKSLENEKTIRELKIKRQKTFTFFLLTGFVSIFLFLLVLFSQIKKIRRANKLLAYQKRQITDSIEYASRIQTAILPPGDYIRRVIPEHFIFYKPRDIVSGDFYWITHKEGKIVVAVVDCTGHGVPGAFMSMLGFAFLNEIVNKKADLKANEILNELRDYVKESLHQTGKEDEAKDGMDIALCVIDPELKKLQYSGAYNPLYLARNDDFISLKADRMPIGIHIAEKESFTNHEMDIKDGDIIYIFTDGYIDQFGGPKSGKFKITPFKEMLMSIQDKPMKEQKEILEKEFHNWKGNRDQIDDVLVMGIKI